MFSAIDSELYVSRSCFITLLFQKDHFHQIQPTWNVISAYSQHFMLSSILYCIAFLKFNVSSNGRHLLMLDFSLEL